MTKAERLARAAAEAITAGRYHDATELEYQAWIVREALARGWVQQFHVERSQVKGGRWITNTSTPGVPDLWLLRAATRQLVVLEVKRERDTTPPERRLQQAAWIAGLQQVPGVDAYIVKPSDAAAVLDLLDPHSAP